MKIKDVKIAFDNYYNYYLWYNGFYTYYWYFSAMYYRYIALSAQELNAFISKFNNSDRDLTKEEECELLKILIGDNFVICEDFKVLISKTSFYKNNNFNTGTRDYFIKIIKLLLKANMLASENINSCCAQQKKDEASLALSVLIEANILPETLNIAMIGKNSSADRAYIMAALNEKELLTPENKFTLENFNDEDSSSLQHLQYAVAFVKRKNILTQENFNSFIKYIIIFDIQIINLISLINKIPLNQQVLDQIFDVCKRSNTKSAIKAIKIYCQILYGNTNHNNTAAVYKTASASAKKLMKSYRGMITSPKEIIKEIAVWLNSLKSLANPDFNIHVINQHTDSKIVGAIRTINYLRETQFVFTDSDSMVNTHQLLALIWAAIHDDKMRQGSIEDAQKKIDRRIA